MSESSQKSVTIYTDGACSGNPGPGGWGALLLHNGNQRKLAGGASHTTNNRMELTAALEALKALTEPCNVTLYTDSKYLRDGIDSWIFNWKKNGWKTAAKKPVLNADLWREIDSLRERHTVEWRWVKGHDGDEFNELVDQLAVDELEKYRAEAPS
jgi:ribonuclease HI